MRSIAPFFALSTGTLAFLRYTNIVISFAFFGQRRSCMGRPLPERKRS